MSVGVCVCVYVRTRSDSCVTVSFRDTGRVTGCGHESLGPKYRSRQTRKVREGTHRDILFESTIQKRNGVH